MVLPSPGCRGQTEPEASVCRAWVARACDTAPVRSRAHGHGRCRRATGTPDAAVFGRVAEGLLLDIDFANNKLDQAQQDGLLAALESPRCRVRVLGLDTCDVGDAFVESVARLVATGALALTGLK